MSRTCAVEGCQRPHRARGFCNSHYMRTRIYGDAFEAIPIRRRTMPGEEPPHGNNSTYTGGCRCAPCRTAHSVAQKAVRAAREAALVALSHEYPVRFYELLQIEKAVRGVRSESGRPLILGPKIA